MDRRYFLQGASGLSLPLLFPVALSPSVSARTMESRAADYFLYDSRFDQARRWASGSRANEAPVPVQGDITRLWYTLLNKRVSDWPLSIAGVTTMSCHFCLQNLLREQAVLRCNEVDRISEDLLAWWITSEPRTAKKGG